jgi:sialidase-1
MMPRSATGADGVEVSDVFVAGAEDIIGVEDARAQYPRYREQNIVVTDDGEVVVVCQARNESEWSDRSGQDLVCKTSRDGGRTWDRARLIVTHGLKSICPNAAVYDRETGRIHVLYNLFAWDFPTPPKHIKRELGENDCRQCVVTSDDAGRTWSQPRDISEMIGANGAVAVFGSGEGIQLRRGPNKGRLIVAGGDFFEGKKVLCYLSDDHGQTWRRSAVVETPENAAMASETKVVELPDGALVLNSRTFVKTDDKQRLRTRAFSRDGGATWTRLENDPDLETVSCNGSLIAVEHPKGRDHAVLLCSVPVGPKRTHGTVYISFDGGKTWPEKKLVVPGGFAYSSLVVLPGGDIGLFFETEDYSKIHLARFSLEWLLADDER